MLPPLQPDNGLWHLVSGPIGLVSTSYNAPTPAPAAQWEHNSRREHKRFVDPTNVNTKSGWSTISTRIRPLSSPRSAATRGKTRSVLLCISRPAERLNWGVPLRFAPDYLWFDALINYLTAAGYLEWTAPWRAVKTDPAQAATILCHAAEALRLLSVLLHPVLPERTVELWRRPGWTPPERLGEGLEWRACGPG